MFLRFLMRGCLKISRPTKTETGTPTRPTTAPPLTTRTSWMRILTVRGTCATATAMGTVMKIRPTTARLFLTRRSRISMAMGWAMRATLTATETASLTPRIIARLCRIRPRKTHWTVGLATNAMRPSCSHHWQRMAGCGWMQARLAHHREMAVLAGRCSMEAFSWACRTKTETASLI